MKLLRPLTAAALALVSFAAHADDRHDFYVVNNNKSVSIVAVQYRHTGTTEAWRYVNLNGRILPRSKSLINANFRQWDCHFDFLVYFEDGYESGATDVNICQIERLNAY